MHTMQVHVCVHVHEYLVRSFRWILLDPSTTGGTITECIGNLDF